MTDIKLLGHFYNESHPLRMAISTIPYIGSYLDQYLSGQGQDFAQRRVEYLIEQLQIEMDAVQESLIESGLLNSEEGYDLTQKTFITAARTRQKEKLNLFAKILKGAFTTKTEIHDPEMYLRIVDELSVREIEVTFLIHRVKVKCDIALKEDTENYEGMSLSDAHVYSYTFPEFSQDELEYTFPRLERTGLVKELVGSYTGYGGGEYLPTPLLNKFISFISGEDVC